MRLLPFIVYFLINIQMASAQDSETYEKYLILKETTEYQKTNEGQDTFFQICCSNSSNPIRNIYLNSPKTNINDFIIRKEIIDYLEKGQLNASIKETDNISEPLDKALAYLDIAKYLVTQKKISDLDFAISKALEEVENINSFDERKQIFNIASDIYYNLELHSKAVKILRAGLKLPFCCTGSELKADGIRVVTPPYMTNMPTSIHPRFTPDTYMSYKFLAWESADSLEERIGFLENRKAGFYHRGIWLRAVQDGNFKLAAHLAKIKKEHDNKHYTNFVTSLVKNTKKDEKTFNSQLKSMQTRKYFRAYTMLIGNAKLYANLGYAYEQHKDKLDEARIYYKKALDSIRNVETMVEEGHQRELSTKYQMLKENIEHRIK